MKHKVLNIMILFDRVLDTRGSYVSDGVAQIIYLLLNAATPKI